MPPLQHQHTLVVVVKPTGHFIFVICHLDRCAARQGTP
jgi:hypothetical protein